MKLAESALCFLAATAAIGAMSMPSVAQTEISRRTELQTSTIVPIQGGTESVRDRQLSEVTVPRSAVSGAAIPGARTVMSEVEIITYGYQLPDFNPDDLYTHHYHFGMFSDNGNGSGTAHPDTDGYVEFELPQHMQESERKIFLYSIHAETGEARVFIDIDELTVNNGVNILTNVAMNARMARERQQGNGFPPRPGGMFRIPPEIGNRHWLGLHGDYLTLDDIQEEIFRQTRCNVEEEDGRFYLESCL